MNGAISDDCQLEPEDSASEPARKGRRIFWLVVLSIVVVSAFGLAKGTGLKSYLISVVTGRSYHHHQYVPQQPPVIAEGPADPAVRFQRVSLPVTRGADFTSVVIGPDHRLYAGTDDGRIFRYSIRDDGTLELPTVITSLQAAEGGKRLLTGFCFDPSATADNPIVWASHGYYGFHDVPDWTGKISRMSGKDLEVVQEVIVDLPRSIRDHLNNQPVFGPDGALYFPQGSCSASGAPDIEWGNRPEHLLSASILRLDVTRVTPGQPLDVRTPDAGGTYDPYSRGAPLTIYASGLRNAYDLVWASDGRLYVPVNGSAAGGNAPAGGGVEALYNLPDAEDDWLFRITPGKYYGHPNPQQGHFVLNGGNPDGRHGIGEIPQYPIGTQPDSDFEPAIFSFGLHTSADGIIEYRGNAFGGKLDRRLLVCRYNLGSDIICLTLDQNGNVSRVESGIVGLSGLAGPLDLTEDTRTGNIYVAEYGGRRIVLLRPLGLSEPVVPVDPSSSSTEPEKSPTKPHPTND